MVFGFWLKTVRTFLENFPKGSIKRHYVCPEQQFEESGLLKIFFSFYHFRTIIEETSHDLQKFEQGCHSCISYVQLNTLQAKCFFFEEKLQSSDLKMDVEPELSGFLAKNPATLTKLFFICLQEHLRVFWPILFVVFGLWAKVFESFAGIDFSRVVKIKFTFPEEYLMWKGFFSNCCLHFKAFRFGAKIFGLLLEGLRTRCRNCVICVQKEVLTKTFSELAFFLIVLGPCAKIFWLSDRVFPAGLSKLELICPGELFKGSLFLWKKVIVFLVVRF